MVTDLKNGETVTFVVRDKHLVPTWWDQAPKGTSPFERGYDQGYLDGINLRYRAEQKGSIK